MVAFGLAVAPLLWVGALKEVMPVTSTDMVERLVPTTVTYVDLPGLAMSVPFPAPEATSVPPYWVLVRDGTASRDFTIVTTATDPRALLSRTVIGRLTSAPAAAAAVSLLAGRGDDVAETDGSRILVEVEPSPDEPVTNAAGIAELADVADGTLVRILLTFDGESTATCVLAGACDRGDLAAGNGVFVHLAHDGAGGGLLVQTRYPSSAVPWRWHGEQIRNGEELEDFASGAGVQALAGWGRILVQESIVHDPDLFRDRLWLGPVLLTILGGLVFAGERLGYPIFRPDVGGSRRWTDAVPPSLEPNDAAGSIPVQVSGHALKPGGGRRYLDEAAGVIGPAGGLNDGRVTAAIWLADGEVLPLAAYDTGLLGRVERGTVVSLGGVRPALWAHWYGTNLRMTFASLDDRDRAAARIGGRGGAPLRSGA